MLNGRCLCGKISYTIQKNALHISHCHCRMCQKSHAAAFGTYARIKAQDYKLKGSEHLASHTSSEQVTRTFCKHCGSHLQYLHAQAHDQVFITVATLDNPPAIQSARHIYTASQVCWFEILDQHPQFLGYPV